MTPWSFWEPDLLPQVPGCPALVARHEVRRAAQVMLKAARAWQINLAVVPVSANQDTVTIAVTDPAEQKLVRVETAWYDGKQLKPTTPRELDDGGDDDWQDHTGTPARFFQLTPGVVSLYPKPAAASTLGLKLRVSVMPGENATGVPDDIAQMYVDDIQAGARARLMAYAGKAWTNLEMAAVYAAAFKAATDKAATDAAKAFVRGRIAARPAWC